MNRTEAVSLAVKAVKLTETTRYVLRRGDKYDVGLSDRTGWKVAEMIGPGNVQNFEHVQTPPPVTSWTPQVCKTRFKELGYWHIPSSPGEGPSFWQCVDLTGDRPAQVGTQYATKAELLANLEAYATEYGCENANPRPRQDENFSRLLAVAKEIAHSPAVDLGDSELRIRLYYAIQKCESPAASDYADTAPHNEPIADRSRDDAGAADPRNDRED